MSDEIPDTEAGPSKSQLKRDARASTRLGEQLVALDEGQLRRFDLPDNILEAVITARKIKQHGAHKRQLLYLGKLLRQIDTDALRQQLLALQNQSSETTATLHRIEQWRDKLLSDDQHVTALLNDYPAIDSQHLRQLIRTARKEQQQGKPPAASRSLFRYLRSFLSET